MLKTEMLLLSLVDANLKGILANMDKSVTFGDFYSRNVTSFVN